MMFERKTEKLLPFPRFAVRMVYWFLFAFGIVLVALGFGILGYHFIARLSWLDALLNASMILTGMGPVAAMETRGAKVFASAYALFSGVVFLSSVGLIFTPIFHRLMHRFHVDDSPGDEARQEKPRR